MQTINYILATAGHVDHGKSALVRALTGVDPDRLPEEKARGITIDLGFAELLIDDGDRHYRAAIIDVPGHEDFVKNMVAGVGSIDVALLVVAADDGWMPQTEEHLQILSYLGVSRGVVALTKSDLIAGDPSGAIDSLRTRLRGSPLESASIVPTSALTNFGLDDLKRALAEVLRDTPAQRDIGKPRLPLDRTFTLKGVGTVVTGTLTGGVLRRGQAVVVQPGGIVARARSVQSHNRDVEVAHPGSRVAINLPDVQPRADDSSAADRVVARGDVVTVETVGKPATVIDVLLERTSRSFANEPARQMKGGSIVRVHHASASAAARVQLFDQALLSAGERAVARLHLRRPMLCFVGDRFIVRDWPEQHTLAGGVVLDIGPSGRADPSRLQRRAESGLDPLVLVQTELEKLGAAEETTLLTRSKLSEADVASAVQRLVEGRQVVRTGGVVADAQHWSGLIDRASAAIDRSHEAFPERAGLPIVELRAAVQTPDAVFESLVADLCTRGFVRSGATIRRASHRPALPARLQAAGEMIRAALRDRPFDPPSRGQLIGDALAQQALKFLVINGEALEIGQDVVLSTDAYAQAIAVIKAHVRAHGPATVSELKTALGSSRRIMVPLLERLDREGVTRRDGDRRSLR